MRQRATASHSPGPSLMQSPILTCSQDQRLQQELRVFRANAVRYFETGDFLSTATSIIRLDLAIAQLQHER